MGRAPGFNGAVAQLGEHRLCKPGVIGSNPKAHANATPSRRSGTVRGTGRCFLFSPSGLNKCSDRHANLNFPRACVICALRSSLQNSDSATNYRRSAQRFLATHVYHAICMTLPAQERSQNPELAAVAKALKARRLVLLLGQAGMDAYVPSTSATIRRRLQVPDDQNLHEWWLTTTERLDTRLSALRELSDHAVVPESLIGASGLPWSTVLTSAIDSVLRKALEAHQSRQLQPVFPGLGGSVLRASRSPLTFAALFGTVDRPAREEQPPSDRRALQERRVEVLQLLDTLHEVVGPNGTLVIEAWTSSDWLRPRDVAPRLFALGSGQVHLFSCDSEMQKTLESDEDFKGLIESRIVVVHRETFVVLLEECISRGFLDRGFATDIDETVHEITLRTRGHDTVLKLQRDSWLRFSRHFVVVDDSVSGFTENRSQTDRFAALRSLLSATQLHHHWRDVRLLGFRRAFSSALETTAIELLESANPQETTLILVGQAGSGKSMALAQLALDLRGRHFPVLYVPPSSVLPDWNQIDAFSTAVETALRMEAAESSSSRPYGGTIATAVVWDGLRDPTEYLRYSEELASRGRRVLIVGSSYYPPPKPHKRVKGVAFKTFRAAVTMDDSEQSALLKHFDGIVPDLRRAVEGARLTIDSNFLVALYRLLPDTRSPISDRLITELRTSEERLKERAVNVAEADDAVPHFAYTSMGQALWDALGKVAPELFAISPGVDSAIPSWMDDAQRILAVVMCAGQYGISVPQELALRCVGGVGERTIQAYREATREDYSIITEIESPDGSIDLRPRHPLEAQEIIRRRHSNPSEQLALMRSVALSLRESDMIDEGSSNLDCVVRLLRQVGPRGRELGVPTASPMFWPLLADIVRDIRKRLRIINPRLLLLEAHVRREWVIDTQHQTRTLESPRDDLAQMLEQIREAEEAVRQAISQLPDRFYGARSAERRFASTVHTELACVLGARQRLGAITGAYERASQELPGELFNKARAECRDARAIYAEYASYDAEFWITRDYVKFFCQDDKERAQLLGDMTELLDEAEQLELAPDAALKVEERRYALAELWDDRDLSEQVLARIDELDSPTAAVLRARTAMGGPRETAPTLEAVGDALVILGALGDQVYDDRRALLLYTRLWWLSKAKQDFFARERLCLPFSQDDWHQLARFMTARLKLETSGYSAFALFHRAWANAQLGDIRAAESDFMEIGRLGAGIARRVRALAVLSESDGNPQKHQAEVRRTDRPTRGFLWVPRLAIEVAFNPLGFELTSPKRFQAVGPVHIVMNYRGLYAENPTLYSATSGRR